MENPIKNILPAESIHFTELKCKNKKLQCLWTCWI